MIKEKGSVIYFSLLVLTIMLGLILGLSTILFLQIRMVRGMENSVVAFYAADSGVERALSILKNLPAFPDGIPQNASGTIQLAPNVSANYQIWIDRGTSTVGGATGGCNRTYYCIRSEGTFRETQRAIEVGN